MRGALEVLSRILWVFVLAGAGYGAFNFFGSYATVLLSTELEMSAPQLAALSAESMVVAVVPYVFARAWDEAFRRWPADDVRSPERTPSIAP